MSAPAGGSGAALGTKVLRFQSLHSIAVLVTNALVFVATIVMANFLTPADFGRLGLLMFFAALLNLLFNLASKQGTLRRTYGGGDDEDDDDDDEDDVLAESSTRSLGTGLVLTLLVSILGGAIVMAAYEPISSAMLADASRTEVLWAVVMGGAGAVARLASVCVWLERRIAPYIFVEVSKPVVTLAAVVPLLAGGGGIEGAIAGTAIGAVASALLAMFALRHSFELCFEPREAIQIYRRGAIRIPIVVSFWIVGYVDLLILSRFVAPDELGIYHLASRTGFLVSFLPAGYRKALRPLRRSTNFAAVEEQYGLATARGIQLGYFLLMLIGVLLAVTLLAEVMVRVAPSSYADAAPLIPILSAGMVAPSTYRMINKSVKFGDKRYWFVGGAVTAATVFVAASFILCPSLGVYGPPLAMLIGFAVPALVTVYKSQTGRSPIHLPIRPTLLAFGPAAAAVGIFELVDPGALVWQVLLAVGLWLAWALALLVSGAVPRYHRAPLVEIVRGLLGRGRSGSDPAAALAALKGPERRVLRRVVLRRRTPQQAVRDLVEVDSTQAPALVVSLLRRAAEAAGASIGDRGEADSEIGTYLFDSLTYADRNNLGKRLIQSGQTNATDLHEIETFVELLRATPIPVWRRPGRSL